MSTKTLTVTMTEDEMKALEQFISRVNLNAKEVPVWNGLIATFSRAVQTPVDESEVDYVE